MHLAFEGGGARLRVVHYEHWLDDDESSNLADLERPPVAEIEEWANQPGALEALLDSRDAEVEPGLPVRMRLPRTPAMTGRKPNSFYEQVAFFVQQLNDRGIAVGPRLAADNDVPVSTVHRWIKEARKRGLLKEGGR
jgi:hypothetical protein